MRETWRNTLLYEEISPLDVSLILVAESEALLPAERDRKKHELHLSIELPCPARHKRQSVEQKGHTGTEGKDRTECTDRNEMQRQERKVKDRNRSKAKEQDRNMAGT